MDRITREEAWNIMLLAAIEIEKTMPGLDVTDILCNSLRPSWARKCIDDNLPYRASQCRERLGFVPVEVQKAMSLDVLFAIGPKLGDAVYYRAGNGKVIDSWIVRIGDDEASTAYVAAHANDYIGVAREYDPELSRPGTYSHHRPT